MVSQSHFIVIFTILFLSVNVFSPSTVSASKDLVVKTCGGNKITNRAFCLKALSTPQAANSKNVIQLVDVAMKDAKAKAQATLNVIIGMMKKPSSPRMLAALKTCQSVYTHSIRMFGIIAAELREDAMSANYNVNLIGLEAGKCIEALKAASVNVPQIVTGNHHLQSYSSLGNGMTSNLQ